MKHIGLNASVLNGTNKVISQSESDWSGIREGSYFKFTNDGVFYPVSKAEEVLYIKDFQVSGNRAKIGENIGISLNVGDTLKISYKEFELLTVISTVNSGKGYRTGDTILLKGGTLSTQIESGSIRAAALSVIEVDEQGGIVKYKITDKGIYLKTPEEICLIEGGSGQGAIFQVQYKLIDTRAIIEREAVEILMDATSTIVVLNYPLPLGLTEGKLSVSKWQLTLSSVYLQGTRLCEPFEVVRDFTPNLNLPLLAKNSLSINSVYNESMVKIDAELAAIKKVLGIS